MNQIDSAIAANRFGLGARPGDLARIDEDPREWLLAQIREPQKTPAMIRGLASSAEILIAQDQWRMRRREMSKEMKNSPAEREKLKADRQLYPNNYWDQAEARHRVAITTDAPFRERLVHFWGNHFAISVDKKSVQGLGGTLVNEAVRPNLTGSFRDLLVAAEKHPAMLLYLDNQNSVGPNSRRATSRKRKNLGINENLARETLELHTLGVDGGYDQNDVTTFALVLSGWSVAREEDVERGAKRGEFLFRETMHEPGARSIMGRTYRQPGVGQGEAVLTDLSRHPSTARHIANKLARHFIADDPPESAVARLEKAFLESDGDLPTVYASLIESREAWQAPLAKYKAPEEYVISAHRALDVVPVKDKALARAASSLGQRTYTPRSPAGWPDRAEDWDGANALIKRIEWSHRVSRGARQYVDARRLAEQILGPVMGSHSRDAIGRAESRTQSLTLMLVSPEFLLR